MHGHGGLVQGAAGGAAAVVYAAEVGELLDAEAACDVDFVVFLDREADHAVDLFGQQAGVGDGRVTALDGKAQGAAA